MFYIDKAIWIILVCTVVLMVKSTPTTGNLTMKWTYSPKPIERDEPKYVDYIKLDILNAMFIGENNHSFALLRWDKTDVMHPTSINLTVRTHTFDGQVYEKTCGIISASNDESDWIYPADMTFLRHDRILLTWAENRDDPVQPVNRRRIEKARFAKFHVISIESCTSSNLSEVKFDNSIELRNFFKNLMILKFKNTFEIISTWYPNEECRRGYDLCKNVFDYDGLLLTTNPELVVKKKIAKHSPTWVWEMNYNGGEGYVLHAPYYYDRSVYSPIQGWEAIDPDFKAVIYKDSRFYSNSSGFATFCWKRTFCNGSAPELRCKWLDGTNNSTLKAKLKSFNFFQILNNPKGNVVLLRSVWKENNKYLVADEIQTNGLCRRSARIQVGSYEREAQVSFVDRNKYCFSYVTRDQSDTEKDKKECTFTTKCIETSDEQLDEPTDC